ncbi:MAG TPA: hypothetical protein PLS49_06270 [Candidatus Woesebacteria bacterium]|nr:hypothetical protein [Candidatus Woesebacteria bacterium]
MSKYNILSTETNDMFGFRVIVHHNANRLPSEWDFQITRLPLTSWVDKALGLHAPIDEHHAEIQQWTNGFVQKGFITQQQSDEIYAYILQAIQKIRNSLWMFDIEF